MQRTIQIARTQALTLVPSELETVDAASGEQPRGRFRTNLSFAQYSAWVRGDVDHEIIRELVGFCG